MGRQARQTASQHIPSKDRWVQKLPRFPIYLSDSNTDYSSFFTQRICLLSMVFLLDAVNVYGRRSLKDGTKKAALNLRPESSLLRLLYTLCAAEGREKTDNEIMTHSI